MRAEPDPPNPRRTRPWTTTGYATAQRKARSARRCPPPHDPTLARRTFFSFCGGPNPCPLDQSSQAKHHHFDPRKQTPGGRLQIGTPAGFKSESVAGFLLECVAGFVGIRKQGEPERVYRFMSAHQAMYPIRTMARVLKVSASGYYAWRSRPASARATADADLTRHIRTIHAGSHGTYGAPRVHAGLKADGLSVGRKRIARLMRAAGIAGISRRRSAPITTRQATDHHPASDLVRRNFMAERPNELWVADMQCAAASGVRDEGRSLAIGLQEQVANHRKRRGSKARVVSVTEKASQGVRCGTGRRTHVNCRSSVESAQTTSKAESDVAPRSAWTGPAYGPGSVRHRGSAILFRLLR